MTLLRRALMIAILVATTLLPTSPAHAAFGSTATAAAAPEWGSGCFWHPIQYSVDVPAGTRYWHLEIRVYRPSGAEDSVVAPSWLTDPPTTGTVQVEICGTDDPEGTWRLEPVVTSWTDAQGVEHETEVPGVPSTFEVGTITPLACPLCEISVRLDLRIVTMDGRRHARTVLVTHYDNERIRIQGARIAFFRKRATRTVILGYALTDRRGVATLSRALPVGSRVKAQSPLDWIQYDDDNRLDLPRDTTPWVRVR